VILLFKAVIVTVTKREHTHAARLDLSRQQAEADTLSYILTQDVQRGQSILPSLTEGARHCD
jgi:hypothetical protein